MSVPTLLATVAAVAITSAVGGLATRPAISSTCYTRLRKPPYQPRGPVFPTVWPTLYADIAVVSATTLDQLRDTADDRKRRAHLAALALHLVLNASWSWLFLSRRAIGVRGTHAAPPVAYPLWCGFAALLTGQIGLLNRSNG